MELSDSTIAEHVNHATTFHSLVSVVTQGPGALSSALQSAQKTQAACAACSVSQVKSLNPSGYFEIRLASSPALLGGKTAVSPVQGTTSSILRR